MLRQLLPVMTLVSLHDAVEVTPWPELLDDEDAPIWQTAVLAQAQYVVSHNLADFPPLVGDRHIYAGIEYLTTSEFISDVLGEDIAEIYGASLPNQALIRSGRQP